ncbi:hypothetical protein Ga0609869_003233 [Rhodovulum iodosum]|uniref:PH domain-containing protein n=1 Tax=Rhodovulum iodosum TaxID=68291 RepID=A0ABV3XYN7_9RHOB|nr:hypothetical protein [Rhodovulum robiginosum]RSK34086.1 hypothetical protein EJA01_08125 [Rhodovulum robiginosum]
MKQGNYLGTTIGGRWWRRDRAKGYFARGNGHLTLDAHGLRFKRLLLEDEVVIPWGAMRGASLVTAHAGQWILGRPVLKIDWRRDGRALASGFYLGRDRAAMRRFADDLNRRIGQA